MTVNQLPYISYFNVGDNRYTTVHYRLIVNSITYFKFLQAPIGTLPYPYFYDSTINCSIFKQITTKEMITQIGQNEWEAVINQTFDIEFDWIGIDQDGQIAIFSSFNRGYIPNKVKESFEAYKQICELINSLQDIAYASQITKISGDFTYWLNNSKKGLVGYDYQDAHRSVKLEQYDLISQPSAFLTIKNITNTKVLNYLPKFNLKFNRDLPFQLLLQTERQHQ